MQLGLKLSVLLVVALAEWIQADEEPISSKLVATKLEEYIQNNSVGNATRYLKHLCTSNLLECSDKIRSPFELTELKDNENSQIYSYNHYETGHDLEDSDPSDEKALWVIHQLPSGQPESITDENQAFMAHPDDALVKINFLMNNAIHVKVCAVSSVTLHEIKCTNERNETYGDSSFSETMDLAGVDEIFTFKFQFKSVKANGLVVIQSVEMAGLTKMDKSIPVDGYFQLKNAASGHFLSTIPENDYLITANEIRDEVSPVWRIIASPVVAINLASDPNQKVTRGQRADDQLELHTANRYTRDEQWFIFKNNMFMSDKNLNKVLDLDVETGKVTMQRKTGKKNQIWLLAPPTKFTQIFNKLDFYPSVKITEVEVYMSPSSDKVIIMCKTNEEPATLTISANDTALGQAIKKQNQVGNIISSPEIAKYKCDAESAVAIFDLKTRIGSLSSDIQEIKFTARVQEKTTEISYKRKNASELQFVCVQNSFREMDLLSQRTTNEGEEKQYRGMINHFNNFACDLRDGQKIEFAFVVRDVYPKIVDFQFTASPYNQHVKVWCSAVSDLIEPRSIPSKISIFFNDEEVATEYNLNKVQFPHENTQAGKYKCVVKNVFGKDNLIIENRKQIKKSNLGVGGGVFTAQFQPLVGTATIHSTFDYDQKFTCKQYDVEIPNESRIQKEEEIKHFHGEFRSNGINAYNCHAKNTTDEISLAVYHE